MIKAQLKFKHNPFITLILFGMGVFTSFTGQAQDYTLLPDSLFEAKLIALGIDTDGINGKVLTSSVSGINTLSVDGSNITDLTGIEDFISLRSFTCNENKLTKLDVSNIIYLSTLSFRANKIDSIDLSKNTRLISFTCTNNLITNLDLSKNSSLRLLFCEGNPLTHLDITNNTRLSNLRCSNCGLSTINLENQADLQYLTCSNNNISALNLENNLKLEYLDFRYCKLTEIDLSNNLALTTINCYKNNLSSLNLSHHTELTVLQCNLNPMLHSICIPNILEAENNANFVKDSFAEWTETCTPVTSISANQTTQSSNIFPNPTSDYFFIQNNEGASIEVYDNSGKLLFSDSVASDEHSINLSQYSPSIYFVKITNKENITFDKVIKN